MDGGLGCGSNADHRRGSANELPVTVRPGMAANPTLQERDTPGRRSFRGRGLSDSRKELSNFLRHDRASLLTAPSSDCHRNAVRRPLGVEAQSWF